MKQNKKEGADAYHWKITSIKSRHSTELPLL